MRVTTQSCFLSLALICSPVALYAQTLIEQVIVTDTRQPSSAVSQPLAFAQINSDAVELNGAIHINELMQQAAGVWISRGNGQEHLTALRSPVLTGAGGCGAFFMAADGISLRAPGFCNVNQLFEVDAAQAGTVEVIKGPGTALYGSNALHGIINVLSATPSSTPTGQFAVGAGPHDYRRFQISYSNTWQQHGLRLALSGASDNGFKDASGYDQQHALVRHDVDGDVWNVTTVVAASNLNQETAGFIRGYNAYKDETLRKTNPNPEAYRDANTLRAYSRLSRDLNSRHRLSITPYVRDNDMQFLQHFLPWKSAEENGHTSAGLQTVLYSQFDKGTLSSGVDIDLTDAYLRETQAQAFSPSRPQGTHYDFQVDALTTAAFAQWQQALNKQWLLDSGVRLEHTRYDYTNRAQAGSACAPQVTGCRFYRPASRSDSFTDVSANAGLSWAYTHNHYAYTRIAQGFRAPQANELYRLQNGQELTELDSESMTNIDVGLRGEFEQGLRYELAAWAGNKRNVIFQDANRQNISGAKTTHRGIDVSLFWPWSKGFYGQLDASISRHRYANDVNLLGARQSIKGNTIDTAPEHFGSARLGWRNARSRIELEWVAMGSYFLEPDNRARYGGHSLINLRASTAISDKLQMSARLLNLSNRDYAERADFGFGAYRYFVGEERALYIELAWRTGD